ncbi:uncharacterized protein LOC144547014 [Carex rostrata]
MAFRRYTPQNKNGKQSQKADPLLLSRDASWLSSLSEPELDLLISLKELAIMRSKFAGHRELANKFDLRMLRALGVILLEHFKEKFKSIPNHAIDADLIDKLPLLTIGLPENVPNSTPSLASLKRKHVHDGLDNTGAESSKKQKIKVKEEPVDY